MGVLDGKVGLVTPLSGAKGIVNSDQLVQIVYLTL